MYIVSVKNVPPDRILSLDTAISIVVALKWSFAEVLQSLEFPNKG